MNIQDRYEGIQTLLKSCGNEGCLFLCLLSIAEEDIGKSIDLIQIIHTCLSKGWIRQDFYVNDSLSILSYLTNKKWTKEIVDACNAPTGQYVITVYYNERTKYTHFRRPLYDTLDHSVTVKEGYIRQFYVFHCKGEDKV